MWLTHRVYKSGFLRTTVLSNLHVLIIERNTVSHTLLWPDHGLFSLSPLGAAHVSKTTITHCLISHSHCIPAHFIWWCIWLCQYWAYVESSLMIQVNGNKLSWDYHVHLCAAHLCFCFLSSFSITEHFCDLICRRHQTSFVSSSPVKICLTRCC